MTATHPRKDASPAEIAMRLASARLDARALDAYPGVIPETLETAYATQEMAIHIWPDRVVGWKIGLVAPGLREKLGAERVAGPIFSRAMAWAPTEDEEVPFRVFVGGFAAVEAEFIFRMGADAPEGKTEWTDEEAARLVGAMHIGVETAGSPMAFINDLGACVVASDFGNNAGLILGPEAPNWRARLAELTAKTEIEGKLVGEGGAIGLPGGPIAGLRFLLSHLASRGRPLKTGQLVSSGAVTGVHLIKPGEGAVVSFGRDGAIRCRAEPARPGA